jgi:hypothetical protein
MSLICSFITLTFFFFYIYKYIGSSTIKPIMTRDPDEQGPDVMVIDTGNELYYISPRNNV